jgi:hypothetical protein
MAKQTKRVSKKKKTTSDKNGSKTDTKFKLGNPGGPGRPKKEICIPHILREIMAEPIAKKSKRTKLDVILDNVVNMAIKGDSWSIQFVADRTEGKPQLSIAMAIEDKRPKFTGKNPTKFLNEYINFQNAEA